MADSDINKLPTYRLGVLETKVDRMQDDVKALDGRVTDLSERVTDLSERVTNLSERVTNLSERVTNLSERVTGLSERLTALYERFTSFEKKTDERFDRLEDRQRSDFRILFRSILAIGGLILAAETGLIAKLTSAVSPLFP